jgi:putative membrane protein
MASLEGLPAFILYLCVASISCMAYVYCYTRLTKHNEFALIAENNIGAAIALGLSLLGFALPVVSAISHSSDIADCIVWSAIALLVQIAVYCIARIPVPDISERIEKGEIAPAVWLGLASVTAGMINSASMSY